MCKALFSFARDFALLVAGPPRSEEQPCWHLSEAIVSPGCGVGFPCGLPAPCADALAQRIAPQRDSMAIEFSGLPLRSRHPDVLLEETWLLHPFINVEGRFIFPSGGLHALEKSWDR